MLLCREGASSAAPHKAIWFTSRQLQISLVKQSRCAATTVRAGKLCICQQHPGQRRVARLAPALCSRASGGKSGGRLTQALASERERAWPDGSADGQEGWAADLLYKGGKNPQKNTAAWPHPGTGTREESNTKAAMHSEVQEKRGEQQEAARPWC